LLHTYNVDNLSKQLLQLLCKLFV